MAVAIHGQMLLHQMRLISLSLLWWSSHFSVPKMGCVKWVTSRKLAKHVFLCGLVDMLLWNGLWVSYIPTIEECLQYYLL
jgi:hypothetical protein